ncbi:MAG: hypothetical protein U0361_04360 [Nitrospiraceae bacterium]
MPSRITSPRSGRASPAARGILAVVKANAYGHGAVLITNASGSSALRNSVSPQSTKVPPSAPPVSMHRFSSWVLSPQEFPDLISAKLTWFFTVPSWCSGSQRRLIDSHPAAPLLLSTSKSIRAWDGSASPRKNCGDGRFAGPPQGTLRLEGIMSHLADADNQTPRPPRQIHDPMKPYAF